ncbi:MAG: TraR/DksA family transcriptional regulator [Sporomusaceae bacterium]|nr:TraR/DksA family transcriptional regulator [Sporomusaceae bacterium]
MRKEAIQQLISALQAKKAELKENIKQIENNSLQPSIFNTSGELSSYDNHSADLASETFERSKDLGLKDNEKFLLSSVERALEKIAGGTYGVCETCGREISRARLEALPWAAECIECSRLLEQANTQKRPLEEEILEPVFERNVPAENILAGKFEEDDALDLVSQYGNSDTPQDLPSRKDYKNLIP